MEVPDTTARRSSDTTAVPAPLTHYDRLAEETIRKIRKLKNPDPRFLQYNNPEPVLIDHGSVLAAPETRVTRLANGMRVATESNMASETATIGVWIDAESQFESDDTNGTAHFLEHMIFKGTKQGFGGGDRQYGRAFECLHVQGADTAKVLKKDVPVALDILADILQNSCFSEDRIARERDVILREMVGRPGLGPAAPPSMYIPGGRCRWRRLGLLVRGALCYGSLWFFAWPFSSSGVAG